VSKIFGENAENKKETVCGVRDDDIIKNSMGMLTAITFDTQDSDGFRLVHFPVNKIYQVALVGRMIMAIAFGLAVRTDFRFGPEILDRINKNGTG